MERDNTGLAENISLPAIGRIYQIESMPPNNLFQLLMTRRIVQALPIKKPAISTSTPPTITWNVACKNGVSI